MRPFLVGSSLCLAAAAVVFEIASPMTRAERTLSAAELSEFIGGEQVANHTCGFPPQCNGTATPACETKTTMAACVGYSHVQIANGNHFDCITPATGRTCTRCGEHACKETFPCQWDAVTQTCYSSGSIAIKVADTCSST